MQLQSVLAILLVTAGSVIATPPGCFLAALNGQQNPADVKAICQNKASDVQNAIASSCTGGDQSAAYTAFADTCKSQGVTVPTPSAASSSASGTSRVELDSYQQPISPEVSDLSPFSEPNPDPMSYSIPNININSIANSPENESKTSSTPGKSSQTSASSTSSSTNLLNSGTNNKSASSSTASGTAKPNAGAQLTGFGITGVLGVAVAGVVGGAALVL